MNNGIVKVLRVFGFLAPVNKRVHLLIIGKIEGKIEEEMMDNLPERRHGSGILQLVDINHFHKTLQWCEYAVNIPA